MDLHIDGPPSLSADARTAAWLAGGAADSQLVLFDVERSRVVERMPASVSRCRSFMWTGLPNIGIAVAHGTGDEDGRLFHLDVRARRWSPLYEGATGRQAVVGVSRERPGHVLVSETTGDGRRDYRVVCLSSGAHEVVHSASAHAAVYFDDRFVPRLVESVNPDASRELRHATGAALYLHVPHEEALGTRVLGFAPGGLELYVIVPDGSAGARLMLMPCEPGRKAGPSRPVFHLDRGHIADVGFGPHGEPALVRVERTRSHLLALEDSTRRPLRDLRRRWGGDLGVLSCSNEHFWVVSRRSANRPPCYGLFDPASSRLLPLSAPDAAQGRPRVRTRPVRLTTRDGRSMTMFISSPAHAARTLAPTVLLIHGGPWRHVRDGYDARRIDLAAAGYTVLEPNFRGSTGAGSEWTNAGDREWGAAMQHDLEDALQWAIERGLADPGRVALVGASYGGYAALQMAATTHLPVRCAIAVAPLTDLAAFVATPPPYWESARPLLRRRIGDPSSAEDRARLDSLSPVNRASGIRVPVLLVHGFNDSRIPIAMTNRMLMALARERRQGLFAIFLDEGHEIVGTVNRSFLRRLTQDFLEEHVLGASSGAESPSVPPQVRLLRTPALTSQAPTC